MAKFKVGEVALVLTTPAAALDGTSRYIGTTVTVLTPPYEPTNRRSVKNCLWYIVRGHDGQRFEAAESALYKPPPLGAPSEELSWGVPEVTV